MKYPLLFLIILNFCNQSAFSQNYTEVLGRPENSSITMNILFDQQVDVYWEYGKSPSVYPFKTDTFYANANLPLEAVFKNLSTDTKYYYRTRYRQHGNTSSFLAGTEHSFHTQRSGGSSFSFAIEADPHLDTNSNPAVYTLTLQNILAKKADFMIDLGDIFMSEKLPVIDQKNITDRHILYRSYFNETCHSVPLYLVIGNHEGELGWSLDGTSGSLPVMAANTRKMYYPNPLPDSFYSGDSIPEKFVGLRENYYAWEWGDALFVVLDPYWYTLKKPGWGWTLGSDQYNWFSKVLKNSHAKFKFVFCHQLVGGNGNDGRGGTEYADYYEMGGNNSDSTWGFDKYRIGWEKPVHQLMVENNVQVFFHGHDHFYGKQEKDGIIYQEVPQPSARNYNNNNLHTQYGYVNGTFLTGRGYLCATVSGDSVKVDFIRTFLPNEENGTRKNGELADSYTLYASPSGMKPKTEIPDGNTLFQNFPNPFNSETFIRYEVGKAGWISLKIYDIFGREITTLADQYQAAGTYSVTFNPLNYNIQGGIYFCKISDGNFSKILKMVFEK